MIHVGGVYRHKDFERILLYVVDVDRENVVWCEVIGGDESELVAYHGRYFDRWFELDG